VKNIIILISIALVMCSIFSCKENYYKNFSGSGDIYDKERTIAIIENDTITLYNFNRALNNNGWHRMDYFDTLQFKKDVLSEEIIFKAASIKAHAYPLIIDNDIVMRQEDHTNAILRSLLFKNNVEPRVKVVESDIEDYYKSNLEKYKIPEQALIAQIIFSTNRAFLRAKYNLPKNVTAEVLDSLSYFRLNEALYSMANGMSFEECALLFSDDSSTAQKGGEWGTIKKGEAEYSYDSTVFSLPVGAVSQPMKTRYGYHIVKMLNHTEEDYMTLDSNLKSTIEPELYAQKIRHEAARFFDSLVAVSEIKLNEEFINSTDSVSDFNTWAAIINGYDSMPISNYYFSLKRELAKNPHLQIDARVKREIINSLAYSWLLISEARKNKFHESQDFIDAKNNFLHQEKLSRLMKEKFPQDYEPTETELDQYYLNHLSEFHEDTTISIQQLIVESKEIAMQAIFELDSGANFYQTALKYYPGEDEDIKKLAINLGWITKDDITSDFFNKIYKYDIDQITEPIKTEWGYHIVKILGKKGIKPFDNVRIEIRKAMIDSVKLTYKNKWDARMVEELDIRVDRDLLEQFMFQVDWMPKPDFSKMF